MTRALFQSQLLALGATIFFSSMYVSTIHHHTPRNDHRFCEFHAFHLIHSSSFLKFSRLNTTIVPTHIIQEGGYDQLFVLRRW